MLVHQEHQTMATRGPFNFRNQPPTGINSKHLPAEALRAEFGRRLQQLMGAKGWTQSDLAREATKHVPKGIDEDIGRDKISKYVRGRVLPRQNALVAIAKALGATPDELLPAAARPSAGSDHPPFAMNDLGDGLVWLSLNQAVSQDVALKVMALVLDKDRR